MEAAVWGSAGSTARVAQVPGIRICGKTGTAQNPHGKDHSIFMAFAPREDPQIAISVYVENAGFGATWAAPIAALMIEKFINGSIAPERKWKEDRVLNMSTIPTASKPEATKKPDTTAKPMTQKPASTPTPAPQTPDAEPTPAPPAPLPEPSPVPAPLPESLTKENTQDAQ